MVQSHFVVTGTDGGEHNFSPLKSWLRANPETLLGIDATVATSHQLRGMLRKKGWTIAVTDNQVLIFEPGLSVVERELVVAETEADRQDLEYRSESDESLEQREANEDLAFGLERQLQEFVAENLDKVQINGSKLHLFVDSSGRNGIEYPSAVGPIDILAQDQHGTFYIFELKRAKSPDRALGQIARYMGWVQKHLADGNSPYGIIVAKEISSNLQYAASVFPRVSLFAYQMTFFLQPIALEVAKL